MEIEQKEIVFDPADPKDPNTMFVRQLICLQLSRMAPVIEELIGEEHVYHLIVLLSKLAPDVALPEALHKELVKRGLVHPAGSCPDWSPDDFVHNTPETYQ